tara:strand:+ start:70 stop:465 length:396 start_codon:yes stop_codon:yes gene_type:complete
MDKSVYILLKMPPTTLAGWKIKAMKTERQRCYAWGQYYEQLEARFNTSYEQVQQVRETLKEVIPEHIKTMLKELIKKAEEDITCPICLDGIAGKDDMKVSNCGHFLCLECYDELKGRSPNGIVKCPTCRKE